MAVLLLAGDSFVGAVAISPLACTTRSRWRLVGLFGLCDGLAVVLGAALASTRLDASFGSFLGPAFAIVYGLYCLAASQWNRLRAFPRLVYLLPPLLSLDNLAAAMGGQCGIRDAATLAVASAAAAAAGFYLGSLVRLATPRARQRAAGAALLCGGGILLLA